jgi:uroporphyrinogen decarboxylase
MTGNIFLETLSGYKHTTTPIWMMRQAGRYLKEYRDIRSTQKNFISFCLNSEQASKVTLQPISRFGFDAAIVFSDILMVPWALQRNVRFKTNIGPILDPMDEPEPIDSKLINCLPELLSPIGNTITRTKLNLNQNIALIGFAGAPWTLITYMAEGGTSRDFLKSRSWAWNHPKKLDALLDSLIESTIQFLSLQAHAGADALMLFDSWASAVPAIHRNWLIIQPIKSIIKGLRDRGFTQPVIGFPKGIGEGLIEYVDESNVTAVGIDHGIDPAWVDRYLPKNFPIQGNLDPISLLQANTKMFSNINYILETFSNRPHIFNLGHGILPSTPIQNVQMMIDYIKKH